MPSTALGQNSPGIVAGSIGDEYGVTGIGSVVRDLVPIRRPRGFHPGSEKGTQNTAQRRRLPHAPWPQALAFSSPDLRPITSESSATDRQLRGIRRRKLGIGNVHEISAADLVEPNIELTRAVGEK